MSDEHADSNYRYEALCLIKSEDLTREHKKIIRKRLSEEIEGDSLLVTSMPGMVKIHYHTNYPEKVFEIAAEYGVFEQKVIEDLKAQAEEFEKKNAKQ